MNQLISNWGKFNYLPLPPFLGVFFYFETVTVTTIRVIIEFNTKEAIAMKISSRFAIAVHVLSLLSLTPGTHNTSEWIAGSVNTNPVVIRRIMGQLKSAGLVTVKAGSGGASLNKSLEEINLLEVYQAVSVVEAGGLFSIHEAPNPACEVGANIQAVLELVLGKAQDAMEAVLSQITMAEVVTTLSESIQRKDRA